MGSSYTKIPLPDRYSTPGMRSQCLHTLRILSLESCFDCRRSRGPQALKDWWGEQGIVVELVLVKVEERAQGIVVELVGYLDLDLGLDLGLGLGLDWD